MGRAVWFTSMRDLRGRPGPVGYLQQLGVDAIWLSPVLKNVQDFLAVQDRFGSDRTGATAQRELRALVDETHARGMYVIADIVLNHAGRLFDYYQDGQREQTLSNPALLNAPLGQEASI
jgi:glycosidase